MGVGGWGQGVVGVRGWGQGSRGWWGSGGEGQGVMGVRVVGGLGDGNLDVVESGV